MNADRKAGIFFGQPHGLRRGIARNHQAGARQYTVAMRADDGVVDFFRHPKVISVDDQLSLVHRASIGARLTGKKRASAAFARSKSGASGLIQQVGLKHHRLA